MNVQQISFEWTWKDIDLLPFACNTWQTFEKSSIGMALLQSTTDRILESVAD